MRLISLLVAAAISVPLAWIAGGMVPAIVTGVVWTALIIEGAAYRRKLRRGAQRERPPDGSGGRWP